MLHFLSATGDPTIDLLSKAGTIGILAFVIVSLMRGWLVVGVAHERVLKERDRALELVYQQAELAKDAIRVAQKVKEG